MQASRHATILQKLTKGRCREGPEKWPLSCSTPGQVKTVGNSEACTSFCMNSFCLPVFQVQVSKQLILRRHVEDGTLRILAS